MTLKEKMTFEGASAYETPSVTTLEVLSEGVLCASGDFDAQDWETGNNNWFE